MSTRERQLSMLLNEPCKVRSTMTRELRMLWLLRIYGPCSFADLIRQSYMSRPAMWAALSRLREKGLADRCKRACYRITQQGVEVLGTKGRPLLDSRGWHERP